jgi:hypothetical protein
MFDPYLSWLGIASKERPLCPYQLLGVQRDECHRQVLEEAALARMIQVRRYQLRFPQEATGLLNEIARALDHALQAAARPTSDSPDGPADASKGPSAVLLTALVLQSGDQEDLLTAYRIEMRPLALGIPQRRKLAALLQSGTAANRSRPQVRLLLHGNSPGSTCKFRIARRVWRAFRTLLRS